MPGTRPLCNQTKNNMGMLQIYMCKYIYIYVCMGCLCNTFGVSCRDNVMNGNISLVYSVIEQQKLVSICIYIYIIQPTNYGCIVRYRSDGIYIPTISRYNTIKTDSLRESSSLLHRCWWWISSKSLHPGVDSTKTYVFQCPKMILLA
jgi:hypothetical protein